MNDTISSDEFQRLATELDALEKLTGTYHVIMHPEAFKMYKAALRTIIAEWQVWWKRWWLRLRWGWGQKDIEAVRQHLHSLETDEPIEVMLDPRRL